MPTPIRIRVGASLDAGALSVFVPLEKAAEKAASNINKSLNRTSKGTRAVATEGKQAGDKLEQELERIANKILRDEEKANRARVRDVASAAKERVRLEKAANREVEQDLARHRSERAKQEKAAAKAEAIAASQPSILDKRWWKAPRGQIGIGRRAAIGVSRAASLAYGIGGSVVSSAFGAAEGLANAEGLDTSVGSHLSNAVNLKAQTTDIVNAGYIPGASGSQGQLQNSAEVLKEIQDAGIKTATSFDDMGEGLRSFVGLTGDLQTGRDTLLDLAKLAKATNANFGDMSKEAAEIANNLGDVPDKGQVVLAVMRAVAGQGKLGAVETKDLARQMAKIAGVAGMFEGGAAANISELGILAQEAKLKGTATSASQAATSVTRFATGFMSSETLKGWANARDEHGRALNPFTDATKTKLRSPQELIVEAIKATHGSIPALGKLFPNAMGRRAVAGFAQIYDDTKGDELEKLKAVNEEFDRLRKAQLSQEEVTRAFTAAMATSKSQIQIANDQLDKMASDLEAQLLPAVAQLAPVFVSLATEAGILLGKFAHFVDPGDKDQADRNNAAWKSREGVVAAGYSELAADIGAGETPLPGGGVRITGKGKAFDEQHLATIQKQADAINAEVAQKERDKAAHPELYSDTMQSVVPGPYGTSTTVSGPDIDGQQHIRELKSLQALQKQTNDLLAAIRDGQASGRVGRTPVKTSTDGVEPPDTTSN